MKISHGILVKGTLWTIGSFGILTVARVAQSIVLARLLAPELFGVMLIVNTLRAGIEQISDLGIGQNVVYSKHGDEREFYNTAWSLQFIRGVMIWLLFLAIAAPIAKFYQTEVLFFIVPISSFTIVVSALASISLSLLRRRLQFVRLNMYEVIITLITLLVQIIIAYFDRTIWALVYGNLLATVTYTVVSYFLLSNVGQRFYISRIYSLEILNFGKWIFISSVVYFLSANFDRLYLAKIVPLNLLGVYGIARAIAELLSGLVARLGNSVLFPFIASHSHMPRIDLHGQLAPLRAKFLLLAAFIFSLFVATADLAIRTFYDQRYHAAAWMLPVLVVGAWFSILTNVNESTLLGLGKPSYAAAANGSKFGFLLIGLPLGVQSFGLFGGVIVVTLVDLVRYVPILIGQRREGFSFGKQDLLITLVMFMLTALWELFRWALGVGTSFDSVPFGMLFHNV